MNDLISALLSAAQIQPPRLRSVVLLDWHDGPVEGIAEMGDPVSYWYFRLAAERPSAEELDDRIYLFALLSEPTIEGVRGAVGSFGDGPLVWPFGQRENRAEIEVSVNAAIASAGVPSLLIQSADFREVKGIWRLVGGAFRPY